MSPTPSPFRAAPVWVWLGVVAGALLGGLLMLAIVRWLGGPVAGTLLGLMQGVVPGLVYCAAARLRDPRRPYQPVTRRSLWLLVGFYGLVLLALLLADQWSGPPRSRAWLAGFLVFTGSSWGSLAAPLLYEYRHRDGGGGAA